MTLMRRPSAFTELVSLRDAMERLFDERFFRPLWTGTHENAPALDLFTTPDAVVAKIALPGVKPEDVDITIADDVVTVSGSFKEEVESKDAGYLFRELSRGEFSRTFTLPVPVKSEAAKATFEHGVLTLTIPKTEEAKPTHVKVEARG